MRSLLAKQPGYGINAPAVPFDGSLPVFLRITDIGEDGRFRPAPRVAVNAAHDSSFFLRSGDIVFAGVGSVGKSYLYDPKDGPLVFSGNLIRMTPDPGRLQPEYLNHYAKSRMWWDWVANNSARSAQPAINSRELGSLRLPLPPLPEQRAIATVLSDVDALIGSLEALISKKRDIKRAAMQQLLTGRTRLPGFRIAGPHPGSGGETDPQAAGEYHVQDVPAGYKRTEVGMIPEDWEVRSMRLLLAEQPGYGINAPAVHFDGSLPVYLRITDIGEDGRFRPAPRVAVNAAHDSRFLLRAGDLVFARTGASVGKSYLYDPNDGPLIFAGFLIRMTPDPGRLQPEYLNQYAKSRRYWDWVANNCARSGQPGINSREFGSLRLPLPPLPEQRAIAAVLSDMDEEIAALERRLDKTRAIKQGMMQQLLTGSIRLPVPDIPVEDEPSR